MIDTKSFVSDRKIIVYGVRSVENEHDLAHPRQSEVSFRNMSVLGKSIPKMCETARTDKDATWALYL